MAQESSAEQTANTGDAGIQDNQDPPAPDANQTDVESSSTPNQTAGKTPAPRTLRSPSPYSKP